MGSSQNFGTPKEAVGVSVKPPKKMIITKGQTPRSENRQGDLAVTFFLEASKLPSGPTDLVKKHAWLEASFSFPVEGKERVGLNSFAPPS